MTEPEKLPLTSMDIAAQRNEELKALFPSVFTETKNDAGELVESIDFEKLKAELGTFSDVFESRRERYVTDWPGKKDCLRVIQRPSVATLMPDRERSIDFDTAKNLFIEGDNLEVLKTLQKSLYGAVKMIFIDPPYNTGNEFIYPDKFAESLDTYLGYAGLLDDEGKRFSTNSEGDGRYHTRWLNMMFPRLYLARNLLADDGVIFISIDDNEIKNLQVLCDEVFGEENKVAHVVWQHSVQPKGYTNIFSLHHNHVLVYRKSEAFELAGVERTEEDNKNYSNPDNDPNGEWRSGDVRNALFRPNLRYNIETPSGKEIEPPPNGWRWSKATVQKKIQSGEIVFSEDESRIIRKIYLKNQTGRAPETIWFAKDVGSTRDASSELKSLFDGNAPFDTVKPTKLIARMMQIAGVGSDDIVLDFFAGSCSTAQAVLESSDCRFIMVQLPEQISDKTPHGKAALSLGFKRVSDIGRARIEKVVKKLKGNPSLLRGARSEGDLGFRFFSLQQSCFRIWQGNTAAVTEQDIARQLELHIDHVDENASSEAILFELMIKAGFAPNEAVSAIEIAGSVLYGIADGAILFCLEDEITRELIDAVAEAEPMQFICLDRAFKGNDQLKANAVQTFAARNQGREKAEQIIFRTV